MKTAVSERRSKHHSVDTGVLCLVVSMTLFGLWGCEAGREDRGNPYSEAIAALESLNAKILTDDNGAVVAVFASKFDTTDAALVHVGRLSTLKQLSLDETRITDADLAHLAGLTNLEKLWLKDTAVTNEGVKHLAGLSSLKLLSLLGTRVTDEGLVPLQGLTELEQLFLGDTRITDAGLKHLECHKNLKLLRLRPC